MNYIQLSHIINPSQDEGTLNVTTAFSIILSDTLPLEVKFRGGFKANLNELEVAGTIKATSYVMLYI